MSAKRQQLLTLLAQGWTSATARREVGISRSASRNWRNGYKVYLKDGTVRFVPPLDPLVTKVISARFLSEAERVEITDRHHAGETLRAIAAAIGRTPSTVSRKLRRNSGPSGRYHPFDAHRAAALRRRRSWPTKLATHPRLLAMVKDRLAQRWSPAQISRALRREFPGQPWRVPDTESTLDLESGVFVPDLVDLAGHRVMGVPARRSVLGRRAVTQGRMPAMVVLVFEVADDHLGFEQTVPMVAVALPSEPLVGRFDVAVVPRRSGRNVGQSHLAIAEPLQR